MNKKIEFFLKLAKNWIFLLKKEKNITKIKKEDFFEIWRKS